MVFLSTCAWRSVASLTTPCYDPRCVLKIRSARLKQPTLHHSEGDVGASKTKKKNEARPFRPCSASLSSSTPVSSRILASFAPFDAPGGSQHVSTCLCSKETHLSSQVPRTSLRRDEAAARSPTGLSSISAAHVNRCPVWMERRAIRKGSGRGPAEAQVEKPARSHERRNCRFVVERNRGIPRSRRDRTRLGGRNERR